MTPGAASTTIHAGTWQSMLDEAAKEFGKEARKKATLLYKKTFG